MPLHTNDPFQTAQMIASHFGGGEHSRYPAPVVRIQVIVDRPMRGKDVEEMFRKLGINSPWEPGGPDPTIEDYESLGIELVPTFIEKDAKGEHIAADDADVRSMSGLTVWVKEPAEWAVPVPGHGWFDSPDSAARHLRAKAKRP